MTEEEWLGCEHVHELMEAIRFGFPPMLRKTVLLGCAAVSRLMPQMTDERSRRALLLTELACDDPSYQEELNNARDQVCQLRFEDGGGGPEFVADAAFQLSRHHIGAAVQAVRWACARRVNNKAWQKSFDDEQRKAVADEMTEQVTLLRDIFGNPFRPVAFDPAWRTEAAVGVARGIYEDRAFERMPILADALQDAGCEHPDILAHCREPGTHVRGCWVVDLVLGKE